MVSVSGIVNIYMLAAPREIYVAEQLRAFETEDKGFH